MESGDQGGSYTVSVMEEVVTVHELSDRPTEFWRQWKKTAEVMRLQVRTPAWWLLVQEMVLQVKHPSTPAGDNKLRFVCMADTHSLTSHLKMEVPMGDVFIHAGDFTRCGSLQEVREFNSWLAKVRRTKR